MRLQTRLCGILLDNPIIPASGTFGFGYEHARFYDINCLGSIALKGTTLEARFGNPTPRIAEAPSGLLNAVGLQNPGVDTVIAEELPKLRACFHKPAIANISGFSEQDYVETARKMNDCPEIGWLEINISCPNVHDGGMSFGVSCESAAAITAAVRKATTKPLILKLSPNVTDIASIAKACEEAGADAISLINTVLAMRIELRTRKPVLANTTGGLSGPAIFPLALRMVRDVYRAVSIPVVGIGGVQSAEDVLEMMMAGACAVQIGAANLVDPYLCPKIIDALPDTMDRYGIATLQEIIGIAVQ